jgi:tetratricopeptide (TPR) repeat protein
MPLFKRKRLPSERRERKLGYHSIEGQRALAEGDPATALKHFDRLVDIFTERAGPTYERTLVWKAFSAKALSALGQLDEALAIQRLVIAERTAAFGPDHRQTLSIRGQLGSALTLNGRPRDGLEVQEAVYEDKKRALGPLDPSTLDTLGNLAEALLLSGYTEEAVDAYRTLLSRRTDVLGADHPDTTRTASNLAIAEARNLGDNPEALDTLARNLRTAISNHGPDSDEALVARGYLGEQHLRLGDGHAALAVLTPLADDRTRLLGPDHSDTLRTQRMVIEAIDLLGDPVRAVIELDGLITRLVLSVGADHPATVHARLLHLQIRADLGQVPVDEAVGFAREVRSLFEPDHEVHEIVQRVIDQVTGEEVE